MQKITPFLWFDTQAEEAVNFYTSLFDHSKIETTSHYIDEGKEIHGMDAGSVMTVEFELSGQPFVALNGGPHFSFNPAISFYVVCETESETEYLWKELSNDGQILMPLDKYDWSDKYGFVQDKYGLSWQISNGKIDDVGQKITPSLMFVNDKLGKAEEAIQFYSSIFRFSEVDGILKYGPKEEGPEGSVKHAQFSLEGQKFMVMDGPGEHNFTFNEAVSFVVNCKTEEEVDYYWDRITAGGVPTAQQCGWLKDQFGVSWQVVPTDLFKMLKAEDPEKVKRVTASLLQMKKIDLSELNAAYEQQNVNI